MLPPGMFVTNLGVQFDTREREVVPGWSRPSYVPLLFTDNETNNERPFPEYPNASRFVKDGIDNFIVHGCLHPVNPDRCGTEAAAQYRLNVGPGQSATVRLRLVEEPTLDGLSIAGGSSFSFGMHFEQAFSPRQQEADEFYASIIPSSLDEDAALVMRQALAGMLWSKQPYHYYVDRWLEERGFNPFRPAGKMAPRNNHWHHMYNSDIISMPDKWEYPVVRGMGLGLPCLGSYARPLDFGKEQLGLMFSERYLHPNGQISAHEWSFSDVNKKCFQKLLLTFTWWVNRKNRSGRNVFEGGFLGLDNIGVFDR
jgi:hypothetical protein